MKKLNDWFEIDEHEYLMYLLKGYEINVNKYRVCWKLNGKLHREDGSAIIYENGDVYFYNNGKRHLTLISKCNTINS